jgi:DNA polymerase I-like protein with 3'-5' exonuclease and polymerase domains
MTILELMEQDKIKGNWTTSTYGKKYESPCPACGGNNRFHVWPDQEEGGQFWCRRCGKSGNVIGYLMYFRGMSYEQAFTISGISPHRSLRGRNITVNQAALKVLHNDQPGVQWHLQSRGFLKGSIKYLWDSRYIVFRNWLNIDRGLKEETIRSANLGWSPLDWYTERKNWGLPEKIKDDGTESKLWIPAGLVIPCFHSGELQRLRIRRHNITEGNRYYVLPGSSSIPMILGDRDIFIIVESELDALLLWQETGDLVGVIALGSALIRPDEEISKMLHHSKKILISLDNDKAGAKESWQWWLSRFPNAIRWPVILGKDPAEAYINKLNLRDWVTAGIIAKHRQTQIVTSPKKVSDLPVDISTVSEPIMAQLEQFKGSSIIALKIVTEGDDPFKDRITFVALCAPDHTPVLLDLTQPNAEETMNYLKELLNSNSEKVLYDAKEAINFFHVAGVEINGPVYDVMLADKILIAGTGGSKRTLLDVIEKYGVITGSKNASISDEAAVLLELREHTLISLKGNNLMETANLEFDCIRAVSEMEKNGIRVNGERLSEMLHALSSRKDILEQALHQEFGNINLNSPKQVMEALHSKNIMVKNTQKGTILPLVSQHPFLSDYLSYKEIASGVSLINGLTSKLNIDTSRLYPRYSQIGAPTGRFSCHDPNLQAIPSNEEFRSCFIAEGGHKLVIADYSQIELRIVAEISQDKRMIDAYRNGEDLHRLTASVIAGKSITDITKDERSAAKAVNFGLIYAMGPKSLKEYSLITYGVSMTMQQARDFRGKFFSAYEGVNRWHQGVQIESPRETRTLGNRRREWGDEYIKVAELLNTPVQGTSADITKRALCILYGRSRYNGIKIIGCIHDEIIIEAPIEEIDAASQILKESMVDAGSAYLKDVSVVVEVSVADNWYEK